jgi:hypothetical protein
MLPALIAHLPADRKRLGLSPVQMAGHCGFMFRQYVALDRGSAPVELFAVASSEQGLDLSDCGGSCRDRVRQVRPELLKFLCGHVQDHLFVLPDPSTYCLRPSQHVLRLFEWGLRHEGHSTPTTTDGRWRGPDLAVATTTLAALLVA